MINYLSLASLEERLTELEQEMDNPDVALFCSDKEKKEIEFILRTVPPSSFPLIPEEDFEEYAQEFAEMLGFTTVWPATCINWEQAAIALASDYSIVEYDGITYYYTL